jgi:hypothetical protein
VLGGQAVETIERPTKKTAGPARPTAGGPWIDRAGGPSGTSGAFPISGLPILDRVPGAPFELSYLGRRQVTLRAPGQSTALIFDERFASDGAGGFTVDFVTVEALPAGSTIGPELLQLLHDVREGFVFRHRDFLIRDPASFEHGYDTTVIATDMQIAGRPAIQIDVRRQIDPLRAYTVDLDAETGLVLGFEERLLATGEVLMQTVLEGLEYDPDPASIEFSGGPSAWQVFDPGSPSAPDLPFDLKKPSYVPDGYRLDRVATRDDAAGRTWVEFVLEDGVEEIFFLHSGSERTAPPPPSSADEVRVSQIGAYGLVEGQIHGTPLIALGKLELGELILLIDSALQ